MRTFEPSGCLFPNVRTLNLTPNDIPTKYSRNIIVGFWNFCSRKMIFIFYNYSRTIIDSRTIHNISVCIFCEGLHFPNHPMSRDTRKLVLRFRPGLTQTGLYTHRRKKDSSNFGYKDQLYYPCSENKGADQLCSYCSADMHLCFCTDMVPLMNCIWQGWYLLGNCGMLIKQYLILLHQACLKGCMLL